MDNLARLKLRTNEPDEAVLIDCLESAKAAILARRYPYGDWPDELEPRFLDKQFLCALDLYNKIGAEGEQSHTENGVSRTYESSWISESLLQDIVPMAKVTN